MNLELPLAQEFGPHLSDDACALEYQFSRIDPYLGLCDEIVVGFSGVRNANSSFVNALIASAIEQHGQKAPSGLASKGYSPTIRVLAEATIALGRRKFESLKSAWAEPQRN